MEAITVFVYSLALTCSCGHSLVFVGESPLRQCRHCHAVYTVHVTKAQKEEARATQ